MLGQTFHGRARSCVLAPPLSRADGRYGGGRHGIAGHLSARTPEIRPSRPDAGDDAASKLARLEAILLLAKEPLSSRKLAELADLADGTEARTLVRQLQTRLELRQCAFQLVEVAGGVQLLSRPELAPWLTRIHGRPDEASLSGPAQETLAVVAYRQPATRADVEAIRGVQCGEILRVLMQRDLLRIVGRSEELGRPFLYGTTKTFLQLFGLRRLDQLPPLDATIGALSDSSESMPTTSAPQLAVAESVEE